MRFGFCTAHEVVFGCGRLRELPMRVRTWGRRVLVVCGRTADRSRPIMEALEAEGLEPRPCVIGGEPSVEDVEIGLRLAREQGVELVVAVGGGSVLDAGKAIAAMLTNGGAVLDYMEVIGEGKPIEKMPLPLVAIPTTAGTGAEATCNAVLRSAGHGVKVSMRSPLLLPRLALVDPQLTESLPPDLTAATGMDALTQLIEPFVSHRANPMVDALCREGIPRVARSLRIAYGAAMAHSAGRSPTPAETAAREDLALASLLSGMALANSGLGAVHGFAASVGGQFAAPHGAVCAALLGGVMEANVTALRRQSPEHAALERYSEIGCLLTGRPTATPEDAIGWARKIREDLGIPGLGTHGVTIADAGGLIERASRASSMKGNPVVLTPDELRQVLSKAL